MTRTEQPATPLRRDGVGPPPLLTRDQEKRFHARWHTLESEFVDDPRKAVEQADELLDDLASEIRDAIGRDRAALRARWEDGDDEASTEILRMSLRSYREYLSNVMIRAMGEAYDR